MKKENNLSIMIISSGPLSKMIQSFNKQLSQKKFYNENDLIFSKLHIKTKNLTEEEKLKLNFETLDLYNTYATSKLFPFERCICIMEYDIVFKDEIIVFQGLTICFNDFILDNFLLENEKEIKELFDDKNLLLIQNMRIIECETHKDFLILLKQKIDFGISFRK